MSSFPIIHTIGLPGAGKTTLAKKLSSRLNLPVLRIGEYRSKYPPSSIGEADAWVALYRVFSKRKWRNCIVETCGLNQRECFLKAAVPFPQAITVKLEALNLSDVRCLKLKPYISRLDPNSSSLLI